MKTLFCALALLFSLMRLNASFPDNIPLEQLTATQVAEIANSWGTIAAQQLGVKEKIRKIDPQTIEKVAKLLQDTNIKIVMRHGEQLKSERVKALPASVQKIAMMRLPDNLDNGLTNASIAELVEATFVFNYLHAKTGTCFLIASSQNQRASFPAETIAGGTNSDLYFDSRLDCVNYPPEEQMSTAAILKLLPDGTLPWEKERVDQVVGQGTFDRITAEMKELLETNTSQVLIAITHTQQMNAIALQVGLPSTRLSNYGFMIVTDQNKQQFTNGFFKD